MVGYEHILAGDMAVFVEPIIEQNRSQDSNWRRREENSQSTDSPGLRQYVEIKAIYQEFFRDMVGTVPPKELAETKKKVITRQGRFSSRSKYRY
ncbi:MAG: hypothetical protein R3C56_28820 [Pirellulaceae bacterium]